MNRHVRAAPPASAATQSGAVAQAPPHRWLADSIIERALLVAVGLTASWLIASLSYEWNAFTKTEQVSTVRLARQLQSLLQRDMEAVSQMLAGKSQLLQASRGGAGDIADLGAVLAQVPAATPLVRSLSLIDSRGRVLASSVPDHVGLSLDLSRLDLGRPAGGVSATAASLIAGRDIDALARPAREPSGDGPNFVPMLRHLTLPGGTPVKLLASVNLAYYNTSFMLNLPEPWLEAAVLNMHGQVLAATPGLGDQVGKAVPEHPFLRQYLPERESGDFAGAGLRGNTVTSAMRALPELPLLVVVESDRMTAVGSRLRPRLLLHGLGFLLAAAVILGLYLLVGWQRRTRATLTRAVERSERERQASDDMLALMLQNIRELVLRIDPDGRLSYVNQRWEAVTGLPSHAVVGLQLAELVQPEDRIRVAALFAPGQGARDPVLVRLKGHGQTLRLEMSVARIPDSDGQVIGYVAIAIDVTRRQKVRERLQDRLDFALRLLEVSPTAMFAKGTDGRYIEVNRAFLQLLDLPPQHVLGETCARLLPDNLARHMAADEHVLRTGESVTYETRTSGPQGVRHFRLTKSRLCDGHGEPVGLVGSIIDVTLYRQAEVALREARDATLRAAHHKLTFERSFLSMAAHELRTPLTSLRLQAEVMIGTAPGVDRRAYSRDLIDSIDRIGHVLEQLMVLTRVDGMRDSRPEMHPVDLQAIYLRVMTDLQEEAAERQIQLRSRLRGCHVPGIEFGVYTLMRNLLHNAIVYCPAGGMVSIAAYRDAEAVVLSVDDSGPGIPVERREHAFERFNRLGQQSVKGSGLGLSIVKTIADLHRASVNLEQSTLGGLRVVVNFPLTPSVPLPFQDSNLLAGNAEPSVAADSS